MVPKLTWLVQGKGRCLLPAGCSFSGPGVVKRAGDQGVRGVRILVPGPPPSGFSPLELQAFPIKLKGLD